MSRVRRERHGLSDSLPSRRDFLADFGMGCTGLALGALLHQDGITRVSASETDSATNLPPHIPPRAKSVIWIFLAGGLSHMESFDVKPALNQYAGKTFDETPFKDLLEPERMNRKLMGTGLIPPRKQIMGLQTGYRPYGECGLVVSDWFPHIGQCADDLAVVRSLWTIHPNHGTQLTWHTGRHPREGGLPTIGSWVSYGLSSGNNNLPEFIVMGDSVGGCCGGEYAHGAGYLGPTHSGVKLDLGRPQALPFVKPAGGALLPDEQAEEFEFIGELNRASAAETPNDLELTARIQSYELAFGMQRAVPDAVNLTAETAETHRLYGIDTPETREFGERCLTARRLVERGVRFVQLYHGAGGAGKWDAHSDIKKGYDRLAPQVDRPIGGLLQDLKRSGLLDTTLVVLGTEFGRTPGAQETGRDHHPQGFCAWLAGGGIKGGVTHGATDELGFYAVEHPHYVTDIHATVLHQLGLDSHKLEIPGRKRLAIDHGQVIREILNA